LTTAPGGKAAPSLLKPALSKPALWTRDGGALRFHFHEGQLRAWDSEARFTFILAGTQGGKTSYGPIWLWREIQRRGSGDYLAVTSSYDLFKLKMLPALRELFEGLLGTGRYWSGDRVIELADPETGKFLASRADDPMWGRIILRSAASGGGLESTTAKGAWADECGQDSFPLEAYEAILRRLSLSGGRLLGTTTLYNLGWVKSEIYDRWQAGDPNYQVVQFPSYLNPLFPREEYERAKATMPAWRFAMFYDGALARPAGLIYESYDPDLHDKDDFAIPPSWPRYVGVDFGAVNTALVWLAALPHKPGVFVLYRESLTGGKSTAEHARIARQWMEQENVVRFWGGAPSEDQQRMDWTHEGVRIQRPPIVDVEAGIDRVGGLFKTHSLYIFKSCKGLRDELARYKRKTDPQGQVTPEIADKATFHRLDALRYVAVGLVPGRFGGMGSQ